VFVGVGRLMFGIMCACLLCAGLRTYSAYSLRFGVLYLFSGGSLLNTRTFGTDTSQPQSGGASSYCATYHQPGSQPANVVVDRVTCSGAAARRARLPPRNFFWASVPANWLLHLIGREFNFH
jgi:hypothetical protein